MPVVGLEIVDAAVVAARGGVRVAASPGVAIVAPAGPGGASGPASGDEPAACSRWYETAQTTTLRAPARIPSVSTRRRTSRCSAR